MTYDELKNIELLFSWQERAYYTAKYAGEEVVLEMGDFPEEQLWSIYLNQKLVEQVNDLPPNWTVIKWETTDE